MNIRDMPAARWLTAGVLFICLLAIWVRQITDASVERDAVQSLRMAINLEQHGVISLDEEAPFSPSNYREPVPIVVSALAVAVSDAVLGEVEPEDYFEGERIKVLKYQNLFWLALLSVGALWAAQFLTSSYYLGLLAVILVNLSVIRKPEIIDNLYTDLPAAAILLLASISLTVAVTRARLSCSVLAGLLFGVLALIKASVLYVFVGVVAILVGFIVLRRSVVPVRTGFRDLGVLVFAFGVVLAPWMYRNYMQVGTFQIAQRGGVVLMCRAVKDLMTLDEYAGSFYVWAPSRLQPLVGAVLGFSQNDLLLGGRLQHLNRNPDSSFAEDDLAAELAGRPDQAVTYYRRSRAERMKLEQEFTAAGHQEPGVEADLVLTKRAIAQIREHPLRHIALTIPFLWRGALFSFPVLAIVLVVALIRRRDDWGIFAVPAFGIVMFYALLSHFIPRYGDPIRPVIIVLIIVLIEALWKARPIGRMLAAKISNYGSVRSGS